MKPSDDGGRASGQPSPPGSLPPASAPALRETVAWRDFMTPSIGIEALVGLLLASFALFHLALHMHAMATTGLWSDEIASIRDFSGQGLWTTLPVRGRSGGDFKLSQPPASQDRPDARETSHTQASLRPVRRRHARRIDCRIHHRSCYHGPPGVWSNSNPGSNPRSACTSPRA